MNVVLADYGAGNLSSVCSAFARAGAEARVSADPREVADAPLAVIAGVGNTGRGGARAPRAPARRALLPGPGGEARPRHLRRDAAPLRRERGGRRRGSGSSTAASSGCARGASRTWAGTRSRLTGPSALLDGLDGEDVYFAHSYACAPEGAVAVAEVEHDGRVVAAVERGAVAGVQFHPERSGPAGARVLRNAVAWSRSGVIPCLDVADGRVVKGVRFEQLRDMGDPVELAARYSELGADELVFLDITATLEGRRPLLELVERAAEELEIPFTVGGGITELADARALLRAGADKVSLNRAAVDDPGLLTALAGEFGAQAVVCAIDSRGGEVVTHAGRRPRGLDADRVGGHGRRARRRRDPARRRSTPTARGTATTWS